MRPVLLLWMALIMSNPPAAAADAAPAPCAAPEYRQFDFWLGEWEVFGKAGRQVGRSRIEAILQGCAIAEHWSSGSGPGSDGKSLNQYNRQIGGWEQFWVDASGQRLLLSGGLQGSDMVLSSSTPAVGDQPAQTQRITWTPNADGSVRQLWESSVDGGQSWTVAFDGLYRRPAAK